MATTVTSSCECDRKEAEAEENNKKYKKEQRDIKEFWTKDEFQLARILFWIERLPIFLMICFSRSPFFLRFSVEMLNSINCIYAACIIGRLILCPSTIGFDPFFCHERMAYLFMVFGYYFEYPIYRILAAGFFVVTDGLRLVNYNWSKINWSKVINWSSTVEQVREEINGVYNWWNNMEQRDVEQVKDTVKEFLTEDSVELERILIWIERIPMIFIIFSHRFPVLQRFSIEMLSATNIIFAIFFIGRLIFFPSAIELDRLFMNERFLYLLLVIDYYLGNANWLIYGFLFTMTNVTRLVKHLSKVYNWSSNNKRRGCVVCDGYSDDTSNCEDESKDVSDVENETEHDDDEIGSEEWMMLQEEQSKDEEKARSYIEEEEEDYNVPAFLINTKCHGDSKLDDARYRAKCLEEKDESIEILRPYPQEKKDLSSPSQPAVSNQSDIQFMNPGSSGASPSNDSERRRWEREMDYLRAKLTSMSAWYEYYVHAATKNNNLCKVLNELSLKLQSASSSAEFFKVCLVDSNEECRKLREEIEELKGEKNEIVAQLRAAKAAAHLYRSYLHDATSS